MELENNNINNSSKETIQIATPNGLEVFHGFKFLNGYDITYLINEFGQIIVPSYIDKKGWVRKTKVLKANKTRKGYLRVGLQLNNKHKLKHVHRLVAQTFIDNPLNKPEVNHIDGDKTNNHVGNLEWCTGSENIIHSYEIGLRKAPDMRGERNNKSKLNDECILDIRSSDLSAKELANKYQVSVSAIFKIRQGIRWTHDISQLKGDKELLNREN